RAFAVATLFNTIAFWMFSLALLWGPISVVSPLRNTVPLFSLLLGYHLLRERTVVWEKAGIILSVISLAFLVGSAAYTSAPLVFSPTVIAALFLAPGTALLCAGILVANKYATSKEYGGMNVIVFITLDHLVSVIIYVAAIFVSGDAFPTVFFSIHLPFLYAAAGISILSALASWGVATACSCGDTVRISPVLRLSVLVSVIAGGTWFMETDLALRITATVLFLIGLIPVIISQEKTKTEKES
ncbi:MAG: EamA family transporter, partial [Patescibacteria group bacterium]